jgi:hypothetical protein
VLMRTSKPASSRGRRYALVMTVLFGVIAVANAVRAAVDPAASASWVVAGLFGLGAACFLAAHLVGRRAGSGRGRR